MSKSQVNLSAGTKVKILTVSGGEISGTISEEINTGFLTLGESILVNMRNVEAVHVVPAAPVAPAKKKASKKTTKKTSASES